MTYYVNPVWDAEHRIYRSESNIAGLHVEAPTSNRTSVTAR